MKLQKSFPIYNKTFTEIEGYGNYIKENIVSDNITLLQSFLEKHKLLKHDKSSLSQCTFQEWEQLTLTLYSSPFNILWNKHKNSIPPSQRFLYEYFIPLPVMYSFEQYVKHVHRFQWTCNIPNTDISFHCNIEVYIDDDSSNQGNSLPFTLLSHLFAILNAFLRQHYLHISYHDLFFRFYLSTWKKTIPSSSGIPWLPLHINSGCTYRYNGQSLFIWRREEIMKVFFHELIHAFGLDFEIDPNQDKKYINYIYRHFSLRSIFQMEDMICFYEGFVEWWACRYHCEWLSQHTKQSFDALYEKECQYAFSLLARVLSTHHFSSWKDFYQPSKKKELCQSTPVFSYIIVKTALLSNVNHLSMFPRLPFEIPSKQMPNTIFNLCLQEWNTPTFGDRVDKEIRLWKKRYSLKHPTTRKEKDTFTMLRYQMIV